MVESEKHCQEQNAYEARHYAGYNAGDNGFPILFQQVELLVQRDRKADGRRGQQETDGVCARGIDPVAYSCQ